MLALTPTDTIQRGMDAARLLGDDVFQGVIEELAAEFMDAWKGTRSEDGAKREALWHHVTALYDIVTTLRNRVDAGTVEQQMQDKRNTKQGG